MSAPCPILGFEFWYRLASGLDPGSADHVLERFIAEVERRGLLAGGGGDVEWRFVITRDGGQATELDREALLAWAAAEPRVEEAAAGAMADMNEP